MQSVIKINLSGTAVAGSVFVKSVCIYRLLVGDCFCEFRYITSILNNLKQFNPLLESEHECPACPKEQCNQFQAGSSLRSKNKSKKLDETALFGASCKHEVPLKFFSLKRGEEIGNAVFLLKWIKEMVDNKSIHVYFFYDIACVLGTHLRNTHQGSILDKVALAIPAFHCYGHKVSCQVNYSGRRLEGFGMSDGKVMERLWSYLRPTGKITKEMTPAHRVDTLTESILIHFARKSISALGDRLCDHFKEAVETKKEMEAQLNLLILKLNETGNKVEISTIEEWSNKEKTAMTKTSFAGKPDDLSGSDAYPEKLRQYYSVRTSLQKSNPGSNTWSILTVQLERLDHQLKKLEIGQARWSPDNPLYLAYIHELHDKRQKDLLLSMHSKCSERWFLLQLMKKYADGQAIARRLCSQISKTTNAVKQLVKEYERPQTSTGSKYPSKVLVEGALDVDSSMWRTIDPSSVPYCDKRQLIDLVHINNRCNEEVSIIQEEMRRILKFYERKIEGLEMWSKEMRARRTDSAECRGLLSIVLTKLDELRAFSGYLRELFSASEKGNLQTSMKQESGILLDMEDFSDNTDSQIESDDDDEDVAEELGESEVFKDLRSVLSAEFGNDSESDSGNPDSDGELNPMI
ncbi:uncharacterized protein [Montipora capricornis]|uniref:uncharacterized protein n=1 Tax=Montipora capricornis TaxID=246305 RepID=UPI0035F1511A